MPIEFPEVLAGPADDAVAPLAAAWARQKEHAACLKQQAPGNPAPEPALVWRFFLNGAAFPCNVFFETPDCTATAGWPIVGAPTIRFQRATGSAPSA